MHRIGKSMKTWEYYRATDKAFAAEVDRIRAMLNGADGGKEVPSFETFCKDYLGQELFWHQRQWVDLIEGRQPRDMHPAQRYERGEPDLLLVNTPPEHAKSTTLTVNYAVWRILQDPNIRIVIVSRTQTFAKKFLTQIKGILVGPHYRELQQHFGPPEGYDAASQSWTQDLIYLSDELRTMNHKDPTVQALGIRGQIYGARADLIILDDCVDTTNAHEYEKQIDWIQSMVMSRIGPGGALMVIGTRIDSVDLYSALREPSYYPDEESPWTYFSTPAVLEFADDPKDWVTMWPRSSEPEANAKGDAAEPDQDGYYPKWDGPRLAKRRARIKPRTWAMVYMQQQVREDSIFPQEAVTGCINAQRIAGRMSSEAPGHHKLGMDGLYIVAGLDPAMVGNTAAVVMGVDRTTRKRWVLDVFNGTTTPDDIRDLIRNWTDRYGVMEWRVEKNAFQIMLTQDRDIRQFLASKGTMLKEHFTGTNKWDTEYGVASMRDLFGTWRPVHGNQWEPVIPPLIDLPSRYNSEGMKAMVE
jgi:hypothetical protein